MSSLIRSILNFFIVILFLGTYEVAVADAYLEMLEDEAKELSLDKDGQLSKEEEGAGKARKLKEAGSNSQWGNAAVSDVLPLGLAQEEFPAYLKINFYGTYVFYTKLNAIDQRTIYYHYSKNKLANIDTVRKDILSHLKN